MICGIGLIGGSNMFGASAIQTVFETVFPPQCISCQAIVEKSGGLCGSCWRDAHFISGLVCSKCGAPLPGDESDQEEWCDDCLSTPRPWDQGRAALLYKGSARRMVLGLKHADRSEICKPAARWMVQKIEPILAENTVVAPIPLHWFRYYRRRYNQSALLAREIAKLSQTDYVPDLLVRKKSTQSLDGLTKAQRFRVLNGAIVPNPRRSQQIEGADVLVVDDVMTSGATFAAATEACFASGAASVCVVALARVQKDA